MTDLFNPKVDRAQFYRLLTTSANFIELINGMSDENKSLAIRPLVRAMNDRTQAITSDVIMSNNMSHAPGRSVPPATPNANETPPVLQRASHSGMTEAEVAEEKEIWKTIYWNLDAIRVRGRILGNLQLPVEDFRRLFNFIGRGFFESMVKLYHEGAEAACPRVNIAAPQSDASTFRVVFHQALKDYQLSLRQETQDTFLCYHARVSTWRFMSSFEDAVKRIRVSDLNKIGFYTKKGVTKRPLVWQAFQRELQPYADPSSLERMALDEQCEMVYQTAEHYSILVKYFGPGILAMMPHSWRASEIIRIPAEYVEEASKQYAAARPQTKHIFNRVHQVVSSMVTGVMPRDGHVDVGLPPPYRFETFEHLVNASTS
ncbi:MAG: hypothetical protein M4579_005211 [Chaenotheca gracillima]|nr:MAG: hypothetical protein M4579_005211 [Chaenotheca gracillima]